MFKIVILFLCVCFCHNLYGKELLANAAHMENAPTWVTKHRIDAIAEKIQNLLEWDIHRVEVYFYSDQSTFEKVHNLGPTVLAVSKKGDNTIHIGPKVTDVNFDAIFGHELVHVISYQKYNEAIPKWLEEGLANELAKAGVVDYKWMNTQPLPADVHELTHPFNGSFDHIRYHYFASQALIEMIAAKCDLRNLLRLSVGMKMESYLDTYCGIKDLNESFKKWLKLKTLASH